MAAAARQLCASSGLTLFSHRLAKQLSIPTTRNPNRPSNLVLSPLSIYSTLSLVAAGARGRTLTELVDTLGAASQELLGDNVRDMLASAIPDCAPRRGGPKVSFACGLWHDATRTLKPGYRDATAKFCRGVARAVDFHHKPEEATKEINSWVAAATSNLIPSILGPGMLTKDTRFVLTNAVYFKGQWETPFQRWRTKVHKFHRLDGSTVDARFMTAPEDQFVAAHDGFKVLKMPYAAHDPFHARPVPSSSPSSQYSMCIFLPDEHDGLWSLMDKISSSPGFLKEHILENRVPLRKFLFPKLKLSFSTSVKEALKDLGVDAMFSRGDELTDMFEDDGSREPLFVDEVLHKAVMEVDEQGTVAAAATAMFGAGAARLPKPPLTTGNRTFAVCSGVCRVQSIGHSANPLFAECQGLGTRQTPGTRYQRSLPSAETLALGKQGHSANKYLPSALGLPSALDLALGKPFGPRLRRRGPVSFFLSSLILFHLTHAPPPPPLRATPGCRRRHRASPPAPRPAPRRRLHSAPRPGPRHAAASRATPPATPPAPATPRHRARRGARGTAPSPLLRRGCPTPTPSLLHRLPRHRRRPPPTPTPFFSSAAPAPPEHAAAVERRPGHVPEHLLPVADHLLHRPLLPAPPPPHPRTVVNAILNAVVNAILNAVCKI
ncbi:hypothetical protein EJB05_44553, partial [Eragrostis curvula]